MCTFETNIQAYFAMNQVQVLVLQALCDEAKPRR